MKLVESKVSVESLVSVFSQLIEVRLGDYEYTPADRAARLVALDRAIESGKVTGIGGRKVNREEVRRLRSQGLKHREIASRLGVARVTVSRILSPRRAA